MPYVKQERRPALDEVLDELTKVKLEYRDVQLFLLELSKVELNKWRWKLLAKDKIKAAIDKAIEVDVQPNGDINYILFKYAKYHVEASYNNYKTFMGYIYELVDMSSGAYKDEFRESAEWIRIKLLIPYEEEKSEESGDV